MTTTVNVVSPSGSTDGAVDLPAEIFAAKVNLSLIHQVVVAQQAAARQGTHSTKTRGAVRGGGKKPYRQKGTGRARQGSTRAPQFTGGGVVHGPVPRSYEQRTPKKMKAAALRGALSDRAAHGRVHVVSGFTEGSGPRTKDAVSVLAAVTGTGPGEAHLLVIVAGDDELTWKSLRNVQGVHLLDSGQLNTYDVLVSDHVVFTQTALDQFLTRSGFPGVVQVGDAGAAKPKKAATSAKAAKPKKAGEPKKADEPEEAGQPAEADEAEEAEDES
jgi:large subunit ribosomal protein L4